ncbi:MAG: hypothetical protein Kow0073_15110 [Immundisolibacter sp.]
MSRLARLVMVLGRLREVERQAGERLAACEAQRAAHAQRLADLYRYAAEYRGRGQIGAVAASTLREHQQFVARLERLALGQEQALAAAERACAQQRAELLRHRRRSEGLQRVIERQRARARQQLERREQRALDDWVNGRPRAAGAGEVQGR